VARIVHDPSHRPVQGAAVTLRAQNIGLAAKNGSDDNGEFSFSAVPIGDYSITVTQQGFADAIQNVTVVSGGSPILHFPLALEMVSKRQPLRRRPASRMWTTVTPTTLVARRTSRRPPAPTATNALQMIMIMCRPPTDVTQTVHYVEDGRQGM